MSPDERLYVAVSGGIPDRVPAMPKIWVDLAAVLTGLDLLAVLADPEAALRAVVRSGLELGLDGARLFHLPARSFRIVDGRVLEVGADGRPLGVVDLQGGLATCLFEARDYVLEDPYTVAHLSFWVPPEPAIRNLTDVRRIAVPDKS